MLRKETCPKLICISLLSFLLVPLGTIFSYAGTWQNDAVGRYYLNDDGSYPASGWRWIDSDHSGKAYGFYFNDAGYILRDTIVPGGFRVNSEGQFVKDGVVQLKETTDGFDDLLKNNPSFEKTDIRDNSIGVSALSNDPTGYNVHVILSAKEDYDAGTDRYYDAGTNSANIAKLHTFLANWKASYIKEGMSELDKYRTIYNYMRANISYNYDIKDQYILSKEQGMPVPGIGQTSYEALIKGSAICSGFANAFVKLAKTAGLDAKYLSSIKYNHAYNMVKIDGKWYSVDILGACGGDISVPFDNYNTADYLHVIPANN